VFQKDDSYIQHIVSGVKLPLIKRRGVYELELSVKPYQKSSRSSSSPFGGQGLLP